MGPLYSGPSWTPLGAFLDPSSNLTSDTDGSIARFLGALLRALSGPKAKVILLSPFLPSCKLKFMATGAQEAPRWPQKRCSPGARETFRARSRALSGPIARSVGAQARGYPPSPSFLSENLSWGGSLSSIARSVGAQGRGHPPSLPPSPPLSF